MLDQTFTIGELLKKRSIYNPEVEALVSPTRRLTYSEFHSISNQISHYMLEYGVEKGDRIALLCCTNFHFSLLYFAAAKIGAITVGINWRQNPQEISSILDDCQPKILFHDDLYIDLVDQLSLRSEIKKIQVLVDYDLDPQFHEQINKYPDSNLEIDVDSENPVALIYTSGTTGSPKGVMISHRNLYESGIMNSCTLQQTTSDRMLYITPLCHVTGTGMLGYQPMIGSTYVFMPQFDPKSYLEILKKERITHALLVPALLRLLFPMFLQTDYEFSTLKEIIAGGSTIPKDLIEKYDSIGFNITHAYASTEALFISFWNRFMGMEYSDTVGKTFLCDLKIVDYETKEPLPKGKIGEIAIKSRMIFKGYWNNPKETEKVLQNGWYYTGDAGLLVEGEYLKIVDRYKDIISCSGGEKVFPAQVEKVIEQLPGVKEVAVIGVKNSIWNELPRAYVVKTTDSSLTETTILNHAHDNLAKYKLTDVVFVDKLPRNALGKVVKSLLREVANDSK